MNGPQGRPTTSRLAVLAAALLGPALLAACGGPAASSAAPAASAVPANAATTATAVPSPSAAGSPQPVACTGVTTQGGFSSASAASPGTLAQIGAAVGFTVSLSMPDTQSALGFNGYEGCRYQFDTPAGGAQEDVALVVGTNPLDGKSAAAEFAATAATRKPLSERQGYCGGCGYSFASVPGLGSAALRGYQDGTDEVVVAVRGRVYVEIGPGDLKETRMIHLAQLILGKVR